MARKALLKCALVVVLLGWISLSYFACDWTPERDNPLDPNSDLYHPPTPGAITGEVRNLSGVAPLSGVMVSLESGAQGVVTASNGKYLIENISDGLHWVKVHKEGYSDDSSQFSAAAERIDTVNFRMNALPSFDSVSVTLHRIHLGGTSYDEYVTIYARIIDMDGNVSTATDTTVLVLFESDTLGKLDYSSIQTSGTYSYDKNFLISVFHLATTQDIIGRPFTLVAKDQANGICVSGPYSIVRYIQDAPLVYTPNNENVFTPFPTLDWDYYGTSFSYHQNARVFDNNNTLVWDSLSIEPLVTQVTVTDSLLPTTGIEGNPTSYYWNLEIVDLFGNTIRSRKLIFWVNY
jgi:hypothetical protein